MDVRLRNVDAARVFSQGGSREQEDDDPISFMLRPGLQELYEEPQAARRPCLQLTRWLDEGRFDGLLERAIDVRKCDVRSGYGKR